MECQPSQLPNHYVCSLGVPCFNVAVLIWDPGVEKGILSHSLCSWELRAIISG